MKKQILLLILISIIGFALGQFSPGKKIDFLVSKMSNKGIWNGSWKTFKGIAEDDQPAMVRAVIARIGLGANTNEEAIYMNATKDVNGHRLNSNNNYKIIVPVDMHVHEFWSLTVYGNNHFLCKNEANKFAVSSFQSLTKNEDGTINIYLSRNQIGTEENWLPLPAESEDISLTLRFYNPKESLINNMESVILPTIEIIK